jgi:ligand-binding sensor domain-containing protein
VKQLVRRDELFARNLALSADVDQQFLYVGGGKGVYILDRKTLEVVGSVTPPGVVGPGHQIATDSKGNLYIAATGMGMQKLTYKGMSKPTS